MATMQRRIGLVLALLVVQPMWCMPAPNPPQDAQSVSGPTHSQPAKLQKVTSTVLDRVVAVVDETAILASDVDEEMRFAALQPEREPAADNTPQRALGRLIDRALIEQQRVLQPGLADVSQAEVDRAVVQLRETIPACKQFHCTEDAGWLAFLKAHEFTLAEVDNRVRERLEILKFMDARFGAAVRISREEVQQYYDHILVPELQRDHAAIPERKTVGPQIREILRQQRVNAMVDQWLKGLHSEGDVRILDSAYGSGEVHGSGASGTASVSNGAGKDGGQ